MGKRFGIALLFALWPAVAGCGTQADKRVLEELGMITAIGIDLEEERGEQGGNLNRITVLFPVINPQASVEEEVLSVVTRSSDARQHLFRMTDRKLVFGQLRTSVYNVDIAERGLMDDLDTLLRDPTVSSRTKLALAEGSARDMLSLKNPAIPRVGQYIDLLLEKESISHFIPRVNVHSFYRDLKDDGIDPVMPILKSSANTIMVEGIGLFRDDRLEGRVKPKDMAYFMMLHEDFHQGVMTVELDEDETVTLSALHSHRDIEVWRRKKDGKLAAEIRLELNGTLVEYTGSTDFKSKSARQKLVRRISRKVEEQCERQVRMLQKLGADCIGIGQEARSLFRYSDWKAQDWHDAFPDVDVRVHVDLRIKEYGMYP